MQVRKKDGQEGEERQLLEKGRRQGTVDGIMSGVFSRQEALHSNMSGMTRELSQ